MQLIVAPSKTQRTDGRDFPEYTQPLFQKESQLLIDLLQKYSMAELSKLMKTSEQLTLSTYRRLHDFQLPFTPENSRQTLFTFQGDTFSTMDAEQYSEGEIHHAQRHLSVLSGLYGILRPLDLIQPYRLEMAAQLPTSRGKNLYPFWTPILTGRVNTLLAKERDSTLVNLASIEYSKVINKKELRGDMVTITFKQQQKDTYKTIPIHSKRARGLMVHFMIVNQITEARDLQQFNLDGYLFRDDISTADSWFFFKEPA